LSGGVWLYNRGSAQGGLADLDAGPLAHPPYALYLTYVISAWTP
jgi:hypothetical protein